MVDLSDLSEVHVGDAVEIFGQRQRVDDLAALLNTIPPLEGACKKIKYLDVAPVFADAIQRIYEENSMSALF